MTDLLYYKNYNAIGDISTIALCIICWLLISAIFVAKDRNLVVFHFANSVVCFAAICSIIYNYFLSTLTQGKVFWAYFFRDATYISLVLTFVLYVLYILNFLEIQGVFRTFITTISFIGLVVFILCEILTPLTKIGFYIDENVQIHENFYYDVFRFAYIYYMLILCSLVILNRKKFITKMFKCVRNVLFISFVVMTVQSAFETTAAVCISFEFPILAVLFLFHYRGYDAETGMMDMKSFNDCIKGLRNKKYEMMFLYLKDINPIKMQALTPEFYHFNERYLRDSNSFRLNAHKMVVVFEKDKNPDAERKIPDMLAAFYALYEEFQLDFKIVYIKSTNDIRTGDDYLELDEFLEMQMQINNWYLCKEKDIVAYGKASYILRELKDIHEKKDLADKRVLVYCQPVINTQTNQFAMAEALMRLNLKGMGIVYPEKFIPYAEKYEYIHTLSMIMLDKTCKYIKQFEEQGYYIERISVNISVQELRDKNFTKEVIGIISNNNVDFNKIGIELTESRNDTDYEIMKKVMNELRALGIRFYLDDFGTGYSNFERILDLPIDTIKFDRSLLTMSVKDKQSRYMVDRFTDIFRQSNYQVLFEGVEDEEDETICRDMEAMYLQGFKYSEPVPIEKLAEFLDANEA